MSMRPDRPSSPWLVHPYGSSRHPLVNPPSVPLDAVASLNPKPSTPSLPEITRQELHHGSSGAAIQQQLGRTCGDG